MGYFVWKKNGWAGELLKTKNEDINRSALPMVTPSYLDVFTRGWAGKFIPRGKL